MKYTLINLFTSFACGFSLYASIDSFVDYYRNGDITDIIFGVILAVCAVANGTYSLKVKTE